MIVATHNETARIREGLQTLILQEGDECRWVLGGQPHPVQRGAFGPVMFYVRITSVMQIRLGQLTEEDAHKLGASSLEAYRGEWRARGKRWHPHKRVYALGVHFTGIPPEYEQINFLDLLKEVSP